MTPPYHRPRSRSFGRLLFNGRAAAMLAVGLLLSVLAYLAFMVVISPGVDDLREAETPRPSVLLSADGQTLARFQREQTQPVPLDRIAPQVVQALIATEDQRFFEHHGVDPLRTVKAAMRTATGSTEGGSTLTQQLARNLFPEEIGRARNINRKVKEAITALRLERLYSKRRILETYLNTAPFLYNVVGIEMAARTYFGKPAAQLNTLESATLVGMLKGTYYYNPVIHPDRAQKRRNLVLAQMVKRGDLPQAEFDRLKTQPVEVQFNRQPERFGIAPHFAVHVRKWLEDWADKNDYDLYRDGLVVQTTLDTKLQADAEQAVRRQAKALQAVADVEWARAGIPGYATRPEAYADRAARLPAFEHFWSRNPDLLAAFIKDSAEFKKAVASGRTKDQALADLLADEAFIQRLRRDKTRLEAGLVALDPHTGEVRAWVGSRDFDQDQFDHVAQAQRQPGSTFKPIVYGAALESGIAPNRLYVDAPIEIPLGDGTVWRPTNMSGSTYAPMTLWEGLVYSKNTITARVMQEVGLPRIASLAQAMGIRESKLDQVPSMALGTSPVTLLEMATVYATIADEGQHHRPLFVRRITDRKGKVVAEFEPESERVLSRDAALDLLDMMRGVVTQGTGTQVRTRFGVTGDLAGKTGTTQNNTDGWFIAMHPGLVVGAWVGFNDQRVTMRSDYWGQGGHTALRVVGDFFQSGLKGGLLDAKAVFPRPLRAPIMASARQPSDEVMEDGLLVDGPAEDAATPEEGETGEIVTVQGAGGTTLGDQGPPKSAEELGRVMSGMGRDPVTGAPAGPPPLIGGSTGASTAPAPASPPPSGNDLTDLVGPKR